MKFDPQNILVMHFGQMGDVILALPALYAIRQRFPTAKITILIGKSSAKIARLAGVFDDEIVVDRVALRDGNKLRSLNKIRQLVKDLRRRKFDFILDLHSLSETNLLGFLSGARVRLYGNRENRSLDFLGKFPVKPPPEDRTKHITDRYLDVLKPLGIRNVPRFVEIKPTPENVELVKNIFKEHNVERGNLVGLFPGAGHPSRRWSVEKFAGLYRRLTESENSPQVIVFLGPEEIELLREVEKTFPPGAIILDQLGIPELIAAVSMLRVLVSNDTGVAHLCAVVGANLVLVMDGRGTLAFMPLTEKISVVRSGAIDEIAVEDVFRATESFLK